MTAVRMYMRQTALVYTSTVHVHVYSVSHSPHIYHFVCHLHVYVCTCSFILSSLVAVQQCDILCTTSYLYYTYTYGHCHSALGVVCTCILDDSHSGVFCMCSYQQLTLSKAQSSTWNSAVHQASEEYGHRMVVCRYMYMHTIYKLTHFVSTVLMIMHIVRHSVKYFSLF